MPSRGSRRQQYTDEYTEESDNSSYKRRRKELPHEDNESGGETHPSHIDEVNYEEAIEALKKQRDDSLLLIKTEHEMRIDSANKLAKFEEERLRKIYETEVEEIKRKISEEKAAASKRGTSEGIYRRHRILPPKNDDHGSNSKKEDSTLTVALPEDVVVEDIRYMVEEWYKLSKKHHLNATNVVVVLPGNRLVINDFFVESGTNCLMKYGNDVIQGQFISADGKEFMFKPEKEKRKKYPLDLLRGGAATLCPLEPEESKS